MVIEGERIDWIYFYRENGKEEEVVVEWSNHRFNSHVNDPDFYYAQEEDRSNNNKNQPSLKFNRDDVKMLQFICLFLCFRK